MGAPTISAMVLRAPQCPTSRACVWGWRAAAALSNPSPEGLRVQAGTQPHGPPASGSAPQPGSCGQQQGVPAKRAGGPPGTRLSEALVAGSPSLRVASEPRVNGSRRQRHRRRSRGCRPDMDMRPCWWRIAALITVRWGQRPQGRYGAQLVGTGHASGPGGHGSKPACLPLAHDCGPGPPARPPPGVGVGVGEGPLGTNGLGPPAHRHSLCLARPSLQPVSRRPAGLPAPGAAGHASRPRRPAKCPRHSLPVPTALTAT